MNCKITRFDPIYETLDELPEVDHDQYGRYVYIPNDDRFYVLSHDGWLPLGIQFSVPTNSIQINLSDTISAVKAETIPCWTEDFISNIQLTLEDFIIDITSAKKAEYLSDNGIKNFNIDILGFNKFSAKSLFITSRFGHDIQPYSSTDNILSIISNLNDTSTKLTDDNKSGLYLGDPCFTISDSLVLDAKFLSILGADDISQIFFDSTSTIQFAIDNIWINTSTRDFTKLTGIPDSYGDITNYLRSNGVDWNNYSIISADEVFAPLTLCTENCECFDSKSGTTSLQQSITQLYKYKPDCIEYIKFEYLVNTDEDLTLLMPSSDPTEVIPRIIYDTRTDEVWVWNCEEWIIDECRSVCKLETNKIYFNTITRKLFYIACDCTVLCLMCLPHIEDPCE